MKKLFVFPLALAMAMALSLGLMSPAQAAVAPPNPVMIAAVTLGDSTLTSSTSVQTPVRLTASAVPGTGSWYAYGDVYVNGNLVLQDQMIGSYQNADFSLFWPKAAGFGSIQVVNVRVTAYSASTNYADSWSTSKQPLPVASNVAPVRRGIDQSAYFTIIKKGKSKATVTAYNWRMYQPDGSQASLKKVRLQRHVKGKWKNFKWVKVNAAGKGTLKFKQSKKYKYRIVIPTTASLLGGMTQGTRKI
jgi:hypothetical protein